MLLRSFITEAFRTIGYRRNAVQPISWMCLVVSLPCFYLANRAESPLRYLYFGFGCVPIILFVVAYVYFMLRDPDRLHSEEFQLRGRALSLVESKGAGIHFDPVDLASISNPYPQPKQIEHGGTRQDA
jgi:hypothetical protein